MKNKLANKLLVLTFIFLTSCSIFDNNKLKEYNEFVIKEQEKKIPYKEKLFNLNYFVNNLILYEEDISQYKVEDYFANPLETLSSGKGDCEDYVILKYYSLLKLGFSKNNLKFIYVYKDKKLPHMVLGFYPYGQKDPLILDSLSQKIELLSNRFDLEEVYSFNKTSIWIHGIDKEQKITHKNQSIFDFNWEK